MCIYRSMLTVVIANVKTFHLALLLQAGDREMTKGAITVCCTISVGKCTPATAVKVLLST